MDDARRERMKLREFFSYIELYQLPMNDMDFYESEWLLWLDRISSSEKDETVRVKSWIKDSDNVEWFAEDISKINKTSWNMYAALIVSIWSKIDHYLKLSCEYIALKKHLIFNKKKFIGYKKFINNSKNDSSYFSSINHYSTLNFIRILNNTFKHSNGWYQSPSEDYNVLDTSLAVKYGIGSNVLEDKIPYENLKFRDLIIDSGIFCSKLMDDIR